MHGQQNIKTLLHVPAYNNHREGGSYQRKQKLWRIIL